MSGGAGRRAAKQIIIEAAKGTALVRADASCVFYPTLAQALSHT